MTEPPEQTAWSNRRVAALAAGGACVIAAALYAPVIGAWFVGDDVEEIWGGHFGGPDATQVMHGGRNFRPLNLWLHDLHFRVWGWNPTPFHITSIALHALAAVLVGFTARRLFSAPGTQSGGETTLRTIAGPMLAGTIFLVMSNHTEAVSWISTRGDVTMTCGLLAAFLCHSRSGRPYLRTLGGLVAYAVALASKEPAVAFPLVLSAFELTRLPSHGRSFRTLLRVATAPWPYYAMVAGYVVVRRLALGTVKSGSFRAEFVGDSIPRLVLRGGSIMVRSWLPALPPAGWAVAALALAAAVTASVLRRDRTTPGDTSSQTLAPPVLRFTVAATALAVLPTARLGASATTVIGERLAYFPSTFAAIGVAWILVRLTAEHRRVGIVAATAVVMASSVNLFHTNLAWRDAGDLAKSVSDQLALLPRDERVYLVAIPDNLGGPYVLRNAVPASLRAFHGWTEPNDATPLGGVALTSGADRVAVTLQHDDNAVRRGLVVRVRSLAPGANFERSALNTAEETVAGARIEHISDRELRLHLPAGTRQDQVWYVSAGRLLPLEVQPGG